MNILFLNSARVWGGNEHWTNLAAGVLSRDNGVYLAYRSRDVGSRFGVVSYRFPFLNEGDPFTLYGLVSIVRRHGIHLLVPTKRKDYVLAGIAARFCNVKNILRLGIVRTLRGGWVDRLVYNRLSDGIVVNAIAVKKALVSSGVVPPDKVRVVYNGLEIDKIDRMAREGVTLEKPFPFTIASAGNITPRKGFESLIRAFSLFLQGEEGSGDCGLMIIGGGPEAGRLQDLVRSLCLQDRVMFTGFQANPYPYLRQCDVFALASRNEGISNAVMEAMALGKPVISTDVGGVREVVEHGEEGLLIGTNDTESMAHFMAVMYHDEDKRGNMGLAAVRKAKAFTVDRMRDGLMNFFESVVVG